MTSRTKPRTQAIHNALCDAVSEHPNDLAKFVAEQFGISRPAVLRHINALIADGFLHASGTTRKTYALGEERCKELLYLIGEMAEDRAWSYDFAPLIAHLPDNIRNIAHYGFTEMFNNAIDHSGGDEILVRLRLTSSELHISIRDNGEGIFHKIKRLLNLVDEREALFELAKGKLTTDPSRHSGEGIFFTSRMFDRFYIKSGGVEFFHHANREYDYLIDDLPSALKQISKGTTIFMKIRPTSTRTVQEVFGLYASADEFSFSKTIVPLRLARLGNENLISRSQAKRVCTRLEKFKVIELDFAEIAEIGQGFADELFRVFATAHPDIELIPIHCSPAVQQMINRIKTNIH